MRTFQTWWMISFQIICKNHCQTCSKSIWILWSDSAVNYIVHLCRSSWSLFHELPLLPLNDTCTSISLKFSQIKRYHSELSAKSETLFFEAPPECDRTTRRWADVRERTQAYADLAQQIASHEFGFDRTRFKGAIRVFACKGVIDEETVGTLFAAIGSWKKHDANDVVFLIDDSHPWKNLCQPHSPNLRDKKHGNPNSIKRVLQWQNTKPPVRLIVLLTSKQELFMIGLDFSAPHGISLLSPGLYLAASVKALFRPD